MLCTRTVPEVAQFGLAPTLLFAHGAVAGQRNVPSDPAVLRGPVLGPCRGHDLLARQAPVGPPKALLVGADAAAVAESPVQDVLRADAAVGGLVEQVRVVPAVLALPEELPHVSFPLVALRAAPQRDDDRDDDGQRGPEQQRPLLPGAAVLPRLVPVLAHRYCSGQRSDDSFYGPETRDAKRCVRKTDRLERSAPSSATLIFTDTDKTVTLNLRRKSG